MPEIQQPEDSLFKDLSPVQGTQRLFHLSIEELYIKKKDEKADQLVQLYLSWFSLSKVIQLAKPLPFDSIVQLPKDIDSVMSFSSEFQDFLRGLINRY